MNFAFLVMLMVCGLACAEPFPVSNDPSTDQNIELAKFIGTEVALEGEVTEFTDSGKLTPYFKVLVSGEEKDELWSAMLFSFGKGNGVNIGNIVRVYGFYSPFEEGLTSVGENNSGFHLLTFCVVNLTTSEVFFFPAGREQCEAWEKGE